MNPLRPAAPTAISYQKRLDALIDEMAASLRYWLLSSYRETGLGQDALPAQQMQAAFDKLQTRWLGRFDDLSDRLSKWFAVTTRNRVDRTMTASLRRAGFTVKMTLTPAMKDAYLAVIDENIGLIRSIGQQHLTQVRTALMQSVQNGRDIGHMAKELEARTGITKRRAAFIARDQNNKATAVLSRTRALEAGITHGVWMHSRGGQVPREPHVAFNGQKFDLAKGHDFGDGEGPVWPSTLINCRCVYRPVIPGFD